MSRQNTTLARERWIIFVDANIFLDLYQWPGEVATKQLAALERHADRVILSDQVRMEFLKNRQRVILEGFARIKSPPITQFPPLLADIQSAKMMNKHIRKAQEQYIVISKKIDKIIMEPSGHDRVFQSFNRIFKKNTPLNLRRPDKRRYEIRNLARRRFALGYPPRKNKDFSIGDAIHWEWIIHCALNSEDSENVLVVSRDGDFGTTQNHETILNDWLKQEFKERVGANRKIELTNNLWTALKKLDELVTDEEEKEEQKILERTLVFKNPTNIELIERLLGRSVPPAADAAQSELGRLIELHMVRNKSEGDGSDS